MADIANVSNISEKIAYLKGLAAGLKIEGDFKMILDATVDILSEINSAVDGLVIDVEELQDDFDDMEDSLDELVDDLFEEDEEDSKYDDEDEIEGYIELVCPKCSRHVLFDIESFNADDDHLCSCGADLFTEEHEEVENAENAENA
ncbi:MAG: CD1247 N-terminal domain-containing protein [Christensenellales bacterium]